MGRGSTTELASAQRRGSPGRQPLEHCGPTGVSLDPDDPRYSHLLSAYWESLGQAEEVIRAQAPALFEQLQAQGEDPMDSANAARAWAAFLAEQGFAVEIQRGEFIGHYSPGQQAQACSGVNHLSRPEHNWLLVEGKIFDPTAARYNPASQCFRPRHYLAFAEAEETV